MPSGSAALAMTNTVPMQCAEVGGKTHLPCTRLRITVVWDAPFAQSDKLWRVSSPNGHFGQVSANHEAPGRWALIGVGISVRIFHQPKFSDGPTPCGRIVWHSGFGESPGTWKSLLGASNSQKYIEMKFWPWGGFQVNATTSFSCTVNADASPIRGLIHPMGPRDQCLRAEEGHFWLSCSQVVDLVKEGGGVPCGLFCRA